MPPRSGTSSTPNAATDEREHDAERDQAASAPVPRAGDQRDADDREREREHDRDVHVDDAREVDEPRAAGEHQERAQR